MYMTQGYTILPTYLKMRDYEDLHTSSTHFISPLTQSRFKLDYY